MINTAALLAQAQGCRVLGRVGARGAFHGGLLGRSGDLTKNFQKFGEISLTDVALFGRSLLLWLEELADLALALSPECVNAHTLALATGDPDEDSEVVLLQETLQRVEGCDSSNISHSIIAVFVLNIVQKLVSDAQPVAAIVAVDSSLVIGRKHRVAPDLAARRAVVRRSL